MNLHQCEKKLILVLTCTFVLILLFQTTFVVDEVSNIIKEVK